MHKYPDLADASLMNNNEYIINSGGVAATSANTVENKLYDDDDNESPALDTSIGGGGGGGGGSIHTGESNIFISSRNAAAGANGLNNKLRHFKQSASASSIRNHRIVFISVMVSSFLLLVFLVCLVIVGLFYYNF